MTSITASSSTAAQQRDNDGENPHSEASKLLEAALQQMDGIIQGARFDSMNELNGNGIQHSDINNVVDSMKALKSSIIKNGSQKPPLGSEDVCDFLSRWLRSPSNNLDDLIRTEAERDSLALERNSLRDQCVRQGARIVELEQLLAAKKELLKKTEQALERERNKGPVSPNSALAELIPMRNRVSALEQENAELRRIIGGNKSPRYVNISVNSDENNSVSVVKEVGFSNKEPEEIPSIYGESKFKFCNTFLIILC